MNGWTRTQYFWTVLSDGHRLCGVHVDYAKIRGDWRTRGPLPYTYVRIVSCQTMRCGYFTVSQVLEL
jgi:hypothetical protein